MLLIGGPFFSFYCDSVCVKSNFAAERVRAHTMAGRSSGPNHTLISRSGGLQITKAAKLQAAAQASGQQTLFSAMRKSARQEENAAFAAAAAPEVLPVDAVASAVAECSAALAASKKALTDVLSAELSLKQLRKECRTAEQHHKAASSLLEALRRGQLNAPSSEADAGLLVYHFLVLSCLTRVQLVYCNF